MCSEFIYAFERDGKQFERKLKMSLKVIKQNEKEITDWADIIAYEMNEDEIFKESEICWISSVRYVMYDKSCKWKVVIKNKHVREEWGRGTSVDNAILDLVRKLNGRESQWDNKRLPHLVHTKFYESGD